MIDQIKNWGELTLVLIGVIAAMIAGLRRVYKSAKWVEESHQTLLMLAQEFKPNGGATMRDQLNRVEHNLADNTQRTAALESWVKEQKTASL